MKRTQQEETKKHDDEDDDDDDDDERSWKTSFRHEMKISIIFNVAKKDKIWMKLRVTFQPFARYALFFFFQTSVNDDFQIFKSLMYPVSSLFQDFRRITTTT